MFYPIIETTDYGHTVPLLISTDFLKYPFWHLFETGIKISVRLQLNFFSVLTEFFFFSCNGYFKKTVEINRGSEGINQRNLIIWADVADKLCFGRT